MKLGERAVGKLLLIAAVLILFASVSMFAPPRDVAASTGTTGALIPLYAYPGPMWQGLIQAKHQYPSVPVIAVINPSNGPGSYQDPTILSGVRALQAAGITVIGYVYTRYAARSLSSAESDVRAYKSLYGLNGAFFDQMSNVPGEEWYYYDLTSYVHSHGMSWSVGNPGTGVPASFVPTMDLLAIYENAGLPSISLIASRTNGFSRQHFAITPYDVGSLSTSYVDGAARYLSYMYITNGRYPQQWEALPYYFTTFMADLSSLGGVGAGSIPISIDSLSVSGSSISGLWTVVRSTSGVTLASGFTPLTFSAIPGGSYVVTVSNYGNYVFSHWSNGDTSNSITITPSQATTLDAYYSTGGGGGGSGSKSITVNTDSLGGSPIKGLWTVIRSSGGAIVDTGFSPLTYSASSGSTYTISVSNYGQYIFNHWSDGSTSSTITVTPQSAMTLTAYYQSSTSSPSTIKLESANSNGVLFHGMWMVIRSSSGHILSTGFTATTFSANSGAAYSITASNYGSHIFSHWSNGSTSRTITVTAGGALTLIAYYT